MFRGLSAVLYKEIIHLKRDPITLAIMFVIPAIQMTIFGYAINTNVEHIRTIVWDRSRTEASRTLIARLEATGTFAVTRQAPDGRELERALVSGDAQVAVEIPADYANRRLAGRQAPVLLLVDGSDQNTANAALHAAQGVMLRDLEEVVLRRVPPGERGSVEIRPRIRFNPDMDSTNFFVPGLIAVIMQIVTVFLTAFSIVRERERGTLEGLIATPVSRAGLLAGKLAPYAVIGFIENVLTIAIAFLIFDVAIAGSVPVLLGLSLAFLVPALGLGLLISTIAKNQAQAIQFALLIMLPSVLLSGFVFPIYTMPAPIRVISYAIPATYYVEILRGVFLRGAGLGDLWDETAILLGMGVLLIALSTARFQKRLG